MNQPANQPAKQPANQPAPRRTSPERWRGWPREFSDPFAEFAQLWNRMAQPFGRGGSDAWVPAVETEETDDAYTIRAELPGMKPDDVDIELRGNELRITGEVNEETSGKTLRHRHGKFAYRATLPTDAAGDKADAQLTDGILTVRLPKTTEAQTRKIDVKS
jgi:HSP20 family protein